MHLLVVFFGIWGTHGCSAGGCCSRAHPQPLRGDLGLFPFTHPLIFTKPVEQNVFAASSQPIVTKIWQQLSPFGRGCRQTPEPRSSHRAPHLSVPSCCGGVLPGAGSLPTESSRSRTDTGLNSPKAAGLVEDQSEILKPGLAASDLPGLGAADPDHVQLCGSPTRGLLPRIFARD